MTDLACPKCATPLPAEREECGRCGLSRAHFDSYVDDSKEISAELAAAWQACLDDWADEARHKQFLDAACREGAYSFAASRYRRESVSRQDDPVSTGQLRRIASMAEGHFRSTLSDRASPAKKTSYRNAVVLLVFVLLLVVLLAVILAVVSMLKNSDPHDGGSAPARAPAERSAPAKGGQSSWQ